MVLAITIGWLLKIVTHIDRALFIKIKFVHSKGSRVAVSTQPLSGSSLLLALPHWEKRNSICRFTPPPTHVLGQNHM